MAAIQVLILVSSYHLDIQVLEAPAPFPRPQDKAAPASHRRLRLLPEQKCSVSPDIPAGYPAPAMASVPSICVSSLAMPLSAPRPAYSVSESALRPSRTVWALSATFPNFSRSVRALFPPARKTCRSSPGTYSCSISKEPDPQGLHFLSNICPEETVSVFLNTPSSSPLPE